MGYVLDLRQVDRTMTAVAGGKGAGLGELSRIEGVEVPLGVCVTTAGFAAALREVPSISTAIDRLSGIDPADLATIATRSAEIRQLITELAIPTGLAAELSAALARLGDTADAYAVRSSATAEDLPAASFAGQQDTYLNVSGAEAILEHVRRCWASLYTERAVAYRLRNGYGHHRVQMAVVVQQMVLPDAAGVLFTADPVSSNRKVASVEAAFGLGEGLVSGLVNADIYKVRDGEIIDATIAAKQVAVEALPEGGTRERVIDPRDQGRPAVTDAQVLALVELGRRIEAHFGHPQDIEWCLAGDRIRIVQSRPITTLFPVPAVDDDANHVYVSVGHQQMMTDPFKPLGISLWQRTTPRPMMVAGGRLFVDVAPHLGAPTTQASIIAGLGRSDPLIGDALQKIVDRDGFIAATPDRGDYRVPGTEPPEPIETDPAIVTGLIAANQASVAALKREIATLEGVALIDFIVSDLQELRRLLFDPRNMQVIMAGMTAGWRLNEQLNDWLGEKNPVDTLSQSVPHNVTSEMGLALLDVADVIRPYPEVISLLETATDESFMAQLPGVAGGQEAHDAIAAYLELYGMRCVGEIDITRPRWAEYPSTLVPMILSNIRNFAPGAGAERFQNGLQEAERKQADLLARLRALPDGEQKAADTKHLIDQLRTFAGYREYPKYGMVSRYFVYKQALMGEAARLVAAGALDDPEDIFFLTLDEIADLVRAREVDRALIRDRRGAFAGYAALQPPRVYTSEGEVITGSYRRDDIPEGALVGVPVSSGTVEGRARVILDMADADLEPGDILVTAYTDPSWTPLFVAIAGMVTEVGGLMTHGAVIAREYGLPAVVSVERATEVIRDGQRIRVHGTDGYVEILPDPA